MTFRPDVVWSHLFSYKSGHVAYLNKLTVRMKQDVLHKADPTVAKYEQCGTGSVPNRCEETRRSPVQQGNFYYVELNADVSCQCGDPSVHLQIQTRRWYVYQDGDMTFSAYYNGG